MPEDDIVRQYFEHVAEYRVAACRECQYAVWPGQIKGHLQGQHKVSRKQAEIVGEQIRSWAGLLQYPSELEVPGGVPRPIPQLAVYADGMLCELDSGQCQQVFRSSKSIKEHWRNNHYPRALTQPCPELGFPRDKIYAYARVVCIIPPPGLGKFQGIGRVRFLRSY